ncbi:MAG TPA: CHASE domain-containing protein, partial [Thermoanaerobaculia bacterium]|nr:CHASE domain-containing protein [Thermoanaerobaculia bacterium]
MTSSSGERGRRSGSESGWFTARRLKSAISSWRSSVRGTDILVASVFVALSLGLGAYIFARAQAAAHLAFTEKAQRLQAAVTQTLVLPQEDLTALSSFLEASGMTTRRQFRLLTEPMLLRHRLVYAFEWLPVVRDSERAAFEEEARDAGLTGYRFWEIGPDGKPIEAGRRPYYVPVHFMEPPSALALGFDVAAEKVRWPTAEKARDSGVIAASPPFGLVEDAGKPDAQPVVAMYAPLYKEGDPASDTARRNALSGFAMAIFRVAPLVDTAAAAADASGLGLALRDPEAREAPVLAQRPRQAVALPRRVGFDLEFPVQFADRRWALTVFALPGAFLPSR